MVKGDAPRERIEQPQLARVGGGKIANQYLQVGAYSMRGSAQEVAKQLQGLTRQPVRIEEVRSSQGQTLHRVRIGPLSDLTEVDMLKARRSPISIAKFYRCGVGQIDNSITVKWPAIVNAHHDTAIIIEIGHL